MCRKQFSIWKRESFIHSSIDIAVSKEGIDRGHLSAADIAGCVIKAMDKNRLYVVPGLSAKLIWLDKRFSPEFFYRFVAFTMKNKFGEKLFMFLARHGIDLKNIFAVL